MTGSKLHKGSVIYDATTGTEQGAILHDGTYTATTTPASTDTLLIKQSGVQKQITHQDLTKFTYTELGALTANGTLSIDPSNGLNTLVVIEGEAFAQAATATWTGPLGAIGSNSTYVSALYTDGSKYFNFRRNTDGTEIIMTNLLSSSVRMVVYEVKVG